MGQIRPRGAGITSSHKIIANIFISFIGAGMLGLPYAFKEVIEIIPFLTVINNHLLIHLYP